MGNIVVQFSMKKMSQAQYDQIISGLEAAGLAKVPGRIFHVAAPLGDGWHVTDVWESEEAFKRFSETMVPILINSGAEPAEPLVLPVHNIIVPEKIETVH